MYNLLSVLIGAFIAIMIPLNGILSEITGNYTSSVMIHIVGLIAIIIVLLISKSKLRIQQGIPLYLYSAGAIGVFTVLFSNISFTSLGVSITIALGLLGQSVSSIIIDHFGLLGMKIVKFEKKKIIGLLLISSGIGVMTIF
ncbi:DMT family transporter [Bacillus sp. DX1.1]|uniref:DMT family transporter n=1 Tax=unclassified Bacillus (in: firmicutes) TaxID=185979 RepID=UPI0025705DEB|nr:MULTISPECIES: DMT family transporter [unclassified Bacillus (in: firmicutes)]MDM5155616.1 DMT family transporter [Bacillus sp. DX1.1]WJE79923.1 DMT family transporter [Bacillus sp. DX3.1]